MGRVPVNSIMRPALALFLVTFLVVPVLSQQLHNITIQVAVGTTNHGDPQILCLPAQWTDILIFFLANYVAHAATLKTFPGESALDITMNTIFTLVCPVSGMRRAISSIFRHARFCSSNKASEHQPELRCATRAGALLMLVRAKHWQPQAGDRIHNIKCVHLAGAFARRLHAQSQEHGTNAVQNDSTNAKRGHCSPQEAIVIIEDFGFRWNQLSRDEICVNPKRKSQRIHGIIRCPPGVEDPEYRFATVPRNAEVKATRAVDKECSKVVIASSSSWGKAFVAIFQSVYAIVTLYRTRENQLEQYGYAAFGLTVAQYFVMSILNLLGMFVTPDYDTMYMVDSDIMEEAKTRGYHFEGVIGMLEADQSLMAEQYCLSVEGSREKPIYTVFDKNFRNQLYVDDRSKRRCPALPLIRLTQHADTRLHNTFTGLEVAQACAACVASLLPLTIVGAISKFRPGLSTIAERVWTMSWLVISTHLGPCLFLVSRDMDLYDEGAESEEKNSNGTTLSSTSTSGRVYRYLAGILLYSVVAVGGFVTVGQMISNYGTCKSLT